ncbi:hypothetical protein PVK06_010996 [Gossypium arboreum]|uniref:CREG-like beta-barrel domain-containing protein n=1 Tax=Gossypium arboreum TaxID=29729 RepID=A0ABR0Q8I2_GOSAR|nr:hypothetical protein PVK06_010996 [Gossypium arboreum]
MGSVFTSGEVKNSGGGEISYCSGEIGYCSEVFLPRYQQNLAAKSEKNKIDKETFKDKMYTINRVGGITIWYVVSFSDGVPDESTGIPYFYLTTLDPTARNALKDHRSSLTLSIRSEPAALCTQRALLVQKSLSQLVLPDANSKESEFAKAALFT